MVSSVPPPLPILPPLPSRNMADLNVRRLLTPAVEIGLEALSNFIVPGFAPSM